MGPVCNRFVVQHPSYPFNLLAIFVRHGVDGVWNHRMLTCIQMFSFIYYMIYLFFLLYLFVDLYIYTCIHFGVFVVSFCNNNSKCYNEQRMNPALGELCCLQMFRTYGY